MLVFLPIFLLLFAALVIALLGIFRPNFKYHWLIAVGGALLTYILVWVSHSQLPLSQSIGGGEVSILVLPAFALRLDEITWPFALALATLGLAVLLTDVGRAEETSWLVWAGDLGITALGLLAVMAENPLTLLIGWSLVDVIEVAILLRQVSRNEVRRRVMFFFAASVLGSMSVLGAVVAAGSLEMDLSFGTIPQLAQIFLVLAAGLRMGIFPLQVVFLRDVHHQRGQGTLLRLVPPATSMPLLVYAAFTPIFPAWRHVLLVFSLLAALYGAAAWARSRDEIQGRIFWITSLAGMMFFATLQFRPESAMAWGLAMLYPGAALFLASVRTRWMVFLSAISVLTISMLPFMPTYVGVSMYSPLNLFVIGMPLAQAALIYGYLRHARRQTEPLRGVERWVQAIYPAGLVILPLTYIIAGLVSPTISETGSLPMWPLLAVVGVFLVGLALYRMKINIPVHLFSRLDRVFSLRWLYDLLGFLYQILGRTADSITFLLEGEGGVLWALVLLVVLVSILSQVALGAG